MYFCNFSQIVKNAKFKLHRIYSKRSPMCYEYKLGRRCFTSLIEQHMLALIQIKFNSKADCGDCLKVAFG